MDAGAAIAYMHDEPGAEVVDATLSDASQSCWMHALNLYEVYYDLLRRTDEPKAIGLTRALVSTGLTLCEDMDEALWQDAGRLKVAHGISVCDSFALALTRRLGGELLSTDHHELDRVAEAGACPIRFIR